MSTRVATSTQQRRPHVASSTAGNRYTAQNSRREAVQYTVGRELDSNGKEQEVLTLEDTPDPPVAGPSNGAAYASNSSARQDPYSKYQPAPKKRKSDVGAGSNAAPQYAASHSAYNAYSAAAGSSNQQQYRAPAAAAGTKRKADDYERDNRHQKHKDAPQSAYSDAEGHFIVNIGALVTNRSPRGCTYTINKQLGQGTFGKVVAATEQPGGKAVALKIIRAVHKYQEAAKTEIKVLNQLRCGDPEGRKKCIRLETSFDYHGHTCLVTPLLSCSVFDYLKDNDYAPFPLVHVQSFAKQLLTSLAYVHDSKLIHTDLKPENILLEDRTSVEGPISRRGKAKQILVNPGIQLIDFGSATFEQDYHATVVSTRHYRAPEIILNMGWNYPCDMWSIGCILVEFITGEALFQTHENLEHLAMMEKVFGPMPPAYAARAAQTCTSSSEWLKKTSSGGRGRVTYQLFFPRPETQKSSTKFVKGMKTLKEIIAKNAGTDTPGVRFYQLCEGLLRWDVTQRLTVHQALDHPFFKTSITMEHGSAPQR
ncbi:hypothetical protein JCM8547_002619 [Rhodosporidiobolus lusitaniae]